MMNPAFRFGAQQGAQLRAVDDLKRSASNDATFVSTPINLPSWGHIAQMCALFHLKGDRRPLAMAKAGHADAYKQLPVTTKNELAAAATLRRPVDGEWYGFIPHTQLFGSTAAALHYNCLSRAIASLTCRMLKIPCIGCYDDFGIISPECLIKNALDISTSFHKASVFAIVPSVLKCSFALGVRANEVVGKQRLSRRGWRPPPASPGSGARSDLPKLRSFRFRGVLWLSGLRRPPFL